MYSEFVKSRAEKLEDSLAFTKAPVSRAHSNSKTKGGLVLRAHKITQEGKNLLKARKINYKVSV